MYLLRVMNIFNLFHDSWKIQTRLFINQMAHFRKHSPRIISDKMLQLLFKSHLFLLHLKQFILKMVLLILKFICPCKLLLFKRLIIREIQTKIIHKLVLCLLCRCCRGHTLLMHLFWLIRLIKIRAQGILNLHFCFFLF